MVNGADRLLKDYVNPFTFKNANLKHPEKPGSNLEFLGPSVLFASSHPQICLHLTMTYARRDKYLNPHIKDLSTFSLICKQLPQGNWTGKEAWISFQMSLGPFGWEFRSMSGGEGTQWIPGTVQGPPWSTSKDVLPLHLKSAPSSFLPINSNIWFFLLFLMSSSQI